MKLEGDGVGGGLVADVFPTERRRAKAVNFGVLYGIGEQSLSEISKCSLPEAREILERWFDAFPQVREWRDRVVSEATLAAEPHVRTLRGRWRRVPGLQSKDSSERARAMRRAVNAPVQGGAADVVCEAMLSLERSEALEALGFSLVLQVHDELILEGPEESSDEAVDIVRAIMELPFLDGSELAVPLRVKVVAARSWAEASHG